MKVHLLMGFERKILTSYCTTWAQYSPGTAYQSMLPIKIPLGLIAVLLCIAPGNHTDRRFFCCCLQGEWQGK